MADNTDEARPITLRNDDSPQRGPVEGGGRQGVASVKLIHAVGWGRLVGRTFARVGGGAMSAELARG
jgi:hypothetical protein